MSGKFCGASLFHGFPAFQRPTEAREKERQLRNFEIPGYRNRQKNLGFSPLAPYASTARQYAAARPIADGVGSRRFPAQFTDGDRNRAITGRRPTPAALSRSNDNY